MKKTIAPIPVRYTYDPTHKGAPYTFDGCNWMNGGDLKEALDKAVKGLPEHKDPNGKWNEGSDIPETNTSVKSSRFTLASDLKGETVSEVLDRYFEEVPSDNWDYVAIIDDMVVIYNMDATEAREMMETFCKINERNVVRMKQETASVIRWFEERVA